MSDFALDKLLKLADLVPEGERTPELSGLRQFAEASRQAEERLAAVGERRAGGASTDELLALPETFQGLALFVRSVALGAEAAGVGLCSAEVLTLLKESLLQPIITKDPDGSYRVNRPSVVCQQPTPLNLLQLLASGVSLFVTGNPEPGIAMLSAALAGVWPPLQALQRRLAEQHFVPIVRGSGSSSAGEEGREGSKEGAREEEAAGEASSGSQAAAGSSAAVAAAVEEREGGGGSKGEQKAEEKQPAEEESKGLRPTAEAAALAAALAEHCPDISLSDLHKSALVLRLFLGCRAVSDQHGEGPGLQEVVRRLLTDCQQLMDLDPSCSHAYVWAAQMLLLARWPVDGAGVKELFEQGVRSAQESQCWLAAGEVAHDYALWLVSSSRGERNVAARQEALLEAGKLLDAVRDAEVKLQPWMPAGRLHQLAARRQQLAELLLQLQAGQAGTLGSGSGASACDFCGAASAQLRLCGQCRAVGYCSRSCQVRAWKLGHKQACKPQTQAGGAGSGGVGSGSAGSQAGEASGGAVMQASGL